MGRRWSSQPFFQLFWCICIFRPNVLHSSPLLTGFFLTFSRVTIKTIFRARDCFDRPALQWVLLHIDASTFLCPPTAPAYGNMHPVHMQTLPLSLVTSLFWVAFSSEKTQRQPTNQPTNHQLALFILRSTASYLPRGYMKSAASRTHTTARWFIANHFEASDQRDSRQAAG